MRIRPTLWFAILPCLWAPARAQPGWVVRVDSVPGIIQDMIWSGEHALAVDEKGVILSSPDGATWTTVDSGGAAWQSLVRTGTGRFLASATDGSWALSGNGREWNHGRGNLYLERPAVLGGKTLATSGNNLYISADDTTWERVGADSQGVSPVENVVLGVASNGKNAVAVGGHSTLGNTHSSQGLAAVSTDGTTWRFLPTDGFPFAARVSWAKDRFFAYVNDVLSSSPDGGTWTPLDRPKNVFPNDLIWTGGQFLMVGGLGSIGVSTDGIQWQDMNYREDSLIWFNRAIWTGSRLILAGTHLVSGSHRRFIVTLDSDNLAIRGARPERRKAWRREGDWLIAHLPAGGQQGRIRLHDLVGRALRDFPVAPGAGQIRLPLTGLGRGTFVVPMENGARGRPASFLFPD